MPLIQSGQDLWTFRDLVEHLLDFHELDTRDGLNERRARAAILTAYRDLARRHSWNYYYRQRILSTVAKQESSTITYDHTGGAAERLVTIAAGTWPDWAAFGRIIIDDVHYEVATRESSTTLTLESTSNPGADVAAGATYTLYRAAYPLPADFERIVRLTDIDARRSLNKIEPSQYHDAFQSHYDTPSEPLDFIVRSTGEHYGAMHVLFGPPPDTAKNYDLFYRASPQPLNIDEYTAGTVAVTNGTTTVTGTGTVFPTNCVGSVIRFSANGNPPSSVVGSLDGSDNPFVMQGVIKTRTSDTALVLEEAATVEIAASSGYVISDPLDIPGSMVTALQRLAEAEFAEKANRKDAMTRRAMARQAILEAMESDAPYDNTGRALPYDPYSRTTVTSE